MALATVPAPSMLAKIMFKDDSGGTYKTQPFLSETLTHVKEVISGQGIRGKRSHEEKMNVGGLRRNGGTITFNPNRLQLEDWLPYITGSAENVDDYVLAEAIKKTLYVEIWRDQGGETFSAGAVSRAVLSGSAGGLLQLALDLIFKSRADLASETADSLHAGLPYPYSGAVLTINSQAYRISEFSLTIDNKVATDHFNNSTEIQELYPSGFREVLLDFSVPYSAEGESLAALAMAESSGELTNYEATLVITAPDSHLVTLTIPELQLLTCHPNVSGPDGEISAKVTSQAYATTTGNDELKFTVADAV